MSKYVNQDSKGKMLPAFGKASALIADGAVIIAKNELEVGDVVVVENAFFDGAMVVDEWNLNEFQSGRRDNEQRKLWFLRYEPARTKNAVHGSW